jgi:hypothetical protein
MVVAALWLVLFGVLDAIPGLIVISLFGAAPLIVATAVLAATLSAHRSAAFGVHVLAALGGDDAGWRQEFRLCRCRGDRR